MGAISFMKISYGKDMKDAYQNAVKDARECYGNNPYNGTISTTYGFSKVYCEIDGNGTCTKAKESKAYQIANEKIYDMDKRECKGIDLGKVSRNITHHNGWHKFLFFGWAAE